MNDKTKEKSLDFEKSLAKLENIIEALEDGDLPLNESIKTFHILKSWPLLITYPCVFCIFENLFERLFV